MHWLDGPIDPGNAFIALGGYSKFKFAIICRHRLLFTNSRTRFKRHYRLACRRGLPGTWFKYDSGHFRWWRIRLSKNAL
jgi:hypothetical protein